LFHLKGFERDADDQSAGSEREDLRKGKDEKSCPEVLSTEARRVPSCIHNDAEEAELSIA
jgi:hypothetical protein